MVDKSDLLELFRLHAESHDKYTYFLLASAGAAIGFAVQKTEGMALSWTLLPVAIATTLWLVSFLAGCIRISKVQTLIKANYTLLQLQHGSHSNQPSHPQELQAAISGTQKAFESLIKDAAFYMRLQFSALVVGVMFFVAWRVAEMARLSP
jgi:hypothetical protein